MFCYSNISAVGTIRSFKLTKFVHSRRYDISCSFVLAIQGPTRVGIYNPLFDGFRSYADEATTDSLQEGPFFENLCLDYVFIYVERAL